MMKIKKKIYIGIFILLLITLILGIVFKLFFTTTKVCVFKSTNNETKSSSTATLVFKNKKINNLTVETKLYGEPEKINGKDNNSEGRYLFVKLYKEYLSIKENSKIDGINFDVILDDDLITHTTKIDYKKLKSTDNNGLTNLKNKNINEVVKYFEKSGYKCK